METQSDQQETVESESREDLQKLANNASRQDENDDEMIDQLLEKIEEILDKTQEVPIETSLFTHEWEIFNIFFNLVETKSFTDEDLSILKKVFKQFMDVIHNLPFDRVLSDDPAYNKTMFYEYFTLINSTTIQNYLNYVPMDDQLKVLIRDCFRRMLLIMCQIISLSVVTLNDDERPTNYIELLSLMIDYVKKDLETSDLTIDPLDTLASTTRHSILNFIGFYSDKTILVPDMIKAGCVETIIEKLTKINKTTDAHEYLKLQLINTIYNISRHDDGIKQLNRLNAANQIKLFQNNNDDTYLDTLCFMTLVLLSTSEPIENYRKRMNNLLDELLGSVCSASKPFNYNYTDPHGFHIFEPLIVLAKLCNDNRSLNYIMEHSRVDFQSSTNLQFFVNLLTNYEHKVNKEDPLKPITCAAIVSILWRASFQDKYKKILKKTDIYFQNIIQKLTKEPDENIATNQYAPKYIENIQKAAQGLLFNIGVPLYSALEQADERTLESTTTEEPLYPEKTTEKPLNPVESTTEETLSSEKSIERWNKNDISQWFQSSNIRTELRDLCRFEDGQELLNYSKIFLETEKLQYQMYSEEFSRRNRITSRKSPLLLHEFTKFSTALRKLEKLNQ